MSSLIRRIELRLLACITERESMSESHKREPKTPHVGRCARIDRDSWAAASPVERREYHRERMTARRARQLLLIGSRSWPSGSIAGANRHGGEHQGNREIERRRRQAERKARTAGGG